MFVRSPRFRPFVVLLALLPVAINGQLKDHRPVSGNSLRQHFIDAQDLQRKGQLTEAAVQYRAFLSEALGQLATGYGVARDEVHAEPLFDEALALEPNSPFLLLDGARTALLLGDLDRSKALAAEYIAQNPEQREKLAQAHQLLGRTLLKLNQTQQARKELERAVELDPTFPNGYDLAVACLDLADEKCAVQVFGEMEKSFGDTAEIHMAFGRAYSESDFQPRAVTEFRRAIAENPRMPGAHYSLAAVLLATGDDDSHVEEAKTELQRELANSPNDAMTYAALGELEANRHHYPEAEAYLKKAVELGSRNPDAFLYLGQMYFATNRSEEAEAALRQSIALTTDLSRNRYQVQKAHFLLGRILMKKGQVDAAHAEMTISRDLANKTLDQDKGKLAALTDASGTPAERSAADTAPTLAPADPALLQKVESVREELRLPMADAYNNLGAIAASGSDYAAAVEYFQRAFEWNPSLDGLDYNWGRAAFAGSDFADAVPPLSRYVKKNSGDAGARSVLAISQYMTADYQGCVASLQPAIGKAELAPQAEFVYAASLVKTGQIAAGTSRLAALEKVHPEISDVHRALGEAFAQRGDSQRALVELHTAEQLNPADAETHYDLGKLAFDGADKAASIPELQTAVRLSLGNARFHSALADAYAAVQRTGDAQRERQAADHLRAPIASAPKQPASPAQ